MSLRQKLSREHVASFVRVGLWVVMLAALSFAGFAERPIDAAQAERQQDETHGRGPIASKNEYVGSSVCSQCHLDIYTQYLRTSMGHSISEITPASLKTLPVSGSYYDERLRRHFDVHASGEKLYQSEYELDSTGGEVFRDTHQLRWIIGSGVNGFGAIVQRDDYLFQAPLSYYSKPRKWGPSPGYEFADYGFNRPILAGCIFCHSGRSRPVPATNGKFAIPPFSEMSIGCENCHGPGAAHVLAMHDGSSHVAKDLSIVNPANLSGELANNICMACHQTGDVRVLQPGKNYSDFRPGTPLDNTLSILMIPPTRESPPDVDHVEHYYSMTLSKCYRGSAGRLRCITCHDPHVEPASQQAPACFNKKSLPCHTVRSCSLPLKTRQQNSPPDACISCHMPKRNVQVISHSSITNHRILARPDEPFPSVT